MALCFILSASQNPAVNENASTTISRNVLVYPLYTEVAIRATVKISPMTRLYVTLVNSKTSSPGKISADKYRITVTVSNEYTSFN